MLLLGKRQQAGWIVDQDCLHSTVRDPMIAHAGQYILQYVPKTMSSVSAATHFHVDIVRHE